MTTTKVANEDNFCEDPVCSTQRLNRRPTQELKNTNAILIIESQGIKLFCCPIVRGKVSIKHNWTANVDLPLCQSTNPFEFCTQVLPETNKEELKF